MDGYKLNFTDKILDNVHGFIEYTDVEREIIELPVFCLLYTSWRSSRMKKKILIN